MKLTSLQPLKQNTANYALKVANVSAEDGTAVICMIYWLNQLNANSINYANHARHNRNTTFSR